MAKSKSKRASKGSSKTKARTHNSAAKTGRLARAKTKTAKTKTAKTKTAKTKTAKTKTAKTKTAKTKTVKAKPEASKVRAGVEDPVAAPAFDLPSHQGERVSSTALLGRPYVLYFYPKDDTPGCTKEACDFRDALGRLSKAGVQVIGVSPDSPDSHERFTRKHALNFRLLSDEDKSAARAYGVWVKKKNYGREYMGIERSTFLVDAQGKVRRAWRRVRVPGHVQAVLDEIAQL